MNCRNCGSSVESRQTPCSTCGFYPLNGNDYCQDCGNPTKDGQVMCTNCGSRLERGAQSHYQGGPMPRTTTVIDEPNTLANIGTFCCTPWIGVILYFVWKDEKPIAAQSVCNWTIASFVVYALFYVIALMFGLLGSFSSM